VFGDLHGHGLQNAQARAARATQDASQTSKLKSSVIDFEESIQSASRLHVAGT
jgi:hypothetical protein